MKITLCGSIAFYKEMLSVKQQLEQLGHEVKVPPHEVKDDQGNMLPVQQYYALRKQENNDGSWIWDTKNEAILAHFDKVAWSDAILVLNYEKKNIKGYVGANTLLEMGLALWLKKGIYLLNAIPEMTSKEEILGMKPIVLAGDLDKLR